MNANIKTYGVFVEEGDDDMLIFSDAMSYAIYDTEKSADTFKREINDRWAGTRTMYKVKPMSIEVIDNE